jgi:hypothetical protein
MTLACSTVLVCAGWGYWWSEVESKSPSFQLPATSRERPLAGGRELGGWRLNHPHIAWIASHSASKTPR